MATTEKAFVFAEMSCSQETSHVEEAMLVGSVGLAGSSGISVLSSVKWEGPERLTCEVGLRPLTGNVPVMALKCSGDGGTTRGVRKALSLVCF